VRRALLARLGIGGRQGLAAYHLVGGDEFFSRQSGLLEVVCALGAQKTSNDQNLWMALGLVT
jgi:hypothetical protein